jgi:hypothetical protein
MAILMPFGSDALSMRAAPRHLEAVGVARPQRRPAPPPRRAPGRGRNAPPPNGGCPVRAPLGVAPPTRGVAVASRVPVSSHAPWSRGHGGLERAGGAPDPHVPRRADGLLRRREQALPGLAATLRSGHVGAGRYRPRVMRPLPRCGAMARGEQPWRGRRQTGASDGESLLPAI